ncbi:SIR2 family protein [Rhodococcus erythropolis]|uniref:SIR2 family protein n=1 Tax=Rhodococcus erythropolis TaxID=1833 RepID=UPI0037BDA5BD
MTADKDTDAGSTNSTSVGVAPAALAPPTTTSASSYLVEAKFSDSGWFELESSPAPSGSPTLAGSIAPDPRRSTTLDENLYSMLSSERLVVLTGLGTSLGLKTSAGAAAPTMRDLFDAVKVLAGFTDVAPLDPVASNPKDPNVEALLSACQFQAALSPTHPASKFLTLAQDRILELCNFVDETTDLSTHNAFLRKVARRQAKLERTQIFTTNYDLAFEKSAQATNANVIDGFGLARQGFFDGNSFDLDVVRRRRGEPPILEPNTFHLLKLHGSIDWDESDGEVSRTSTPKNPVLIYPSQHKYQLAFRPPYLESMSRLQMGLREPDITLVSIGFGFNDDHITGPIEAAIRSNIGLRLIVVRPDAKTSTKWHPTMSMLDKLIDSGDRRITLLNMTFSDFVKLIPETSPSDERELHSERVIKAGRGI